jgi:hypothetical protein
VATTAPTASRATVARRFDLSAEPRLDLAGVRLHESRRSLQGIAYDTVNRRLFIAQQRDGRPGADLCINQLTPAGEVVAHLHVDNAGHGQSFGVEPVGSASVLWLEWDANENTTDGRGTALARFEFVPGRRPEPEILFAAGVEVGCAIDPVARRLLIRRPEDGRTMYHLYDLEDARKRSPRPIASLQEPARLHPGSGPTVLQAFTVLGDFLYTFVGTGGHAGTRRDPFNSYLSAVAVDGGKVVQQELVTAGRSLVYREPEGLAVDVVNGVPRLCFGFSSQPTPTSPRRYANLFHVDATR